MAHLTAVLALSLLTHAQPEPPPQPINPCDSILITQTRAALSDLRAAAASHAGPAGSAITAVYEGTVSIEAHLMRPGMVRTLPLRLELTADPSTGALSLRETAGPAASAQPETTLILHGRIAQQPAPDKPFAEIAADLAPARIADAALWLPATAALAAINAAPSCRPGPSCATSGDTLSPITFTDAAGRACTLLLDADRRIRRIERLTAHQRLGDACDWTSFDGWEEHGGAAMPTRLSRFILDSSVTLRFDLTLVSAATGPADDAAFLLPESSRSDIPTWGQPPPPTGGMEFVTLAPSLWSVEIAAADARVLVLERASDLVVMGAPDGDAVCTSLVKALAARFPSKPIALAAFGHHHPSPSGGLRALAAAGATIIAPRDLEPYIRELLNRPTTLGPPAIAAPPRPRLEFFDGETTIRGDGTTIRLIDIGEASAHTFRYTVFYLPEPGILFEDDLGYFPLTGATRAGPRLLGLAAALQERGIVPRRLIQLWPVRNVHREVEWATVAELVKAELERQQSR